MTDFNNIIETATARVEEVRHALGTAVRTEKQLRQDLKRVEVKLGLDPENVDTLAEKAAIIENLADSTMAIEQEQYNLDSAQKSKQAAQEEMVAQECLEIAKSINIDVGVDYEENPVLAARLISSMASSLQYSLESGLPYYQRLVAKFHTRQVGENEGMSGNEDSSDFSYDTEMEITRIEDERRHMSAMMYALKREYNKVSANRDPNASWFPSFLNRTNGQVRQQVEEREAKRVQTFLDQQAATRKAATEFAAVASPTPSF